MLLILLYVLVIAFVLVFSLFPDLRVRRRWYGSRRRWRYTEGVDDILREQKVLTTRR